jgi:putative PEP-CTERM system TPR-repeat lipoprotein
MRYLSHKLRPGLSRSLGAVLLLFALSSHANVIEFDAPELVPGAGSQAQVDRIMKELDKQAYDEALALAIAMTKERPNDPAGYDLQGMAWFGKDDLARARQSFEKALTITPGDKQAMSYLAQLDIAQQDVASARKRYEKLLAADPKYGPALIGMGKLEANAGNTNESLAWLDRAKAANPQAVYPRLVFGAYYLAKKDYVRAINELKDAQTFHAHNVDVLDLLGQAQLADGQVAEAIGTFKQLRTYRPALPIAHYRLASAQLRADDTQGAIASLKRAIELKPDYAEALLALAEIDMRAKEYDAALAIAKRLQAISTNVSIGLALEGDVRMAQARYPDAAAAYAKALATSSSNLFAIKLHAARVKAGNEKEADTDLLKWINAHPQDIGAPQYLADQYARAGKNKLAIAQYEHVLKIDPRNALALNNLANAYYREKDPRALATAEQAYEAAPDSPLTADTLGWILVEQEKMPRGLELLQKAASQDGKNREIAYHLAAALARSGDKVAARRQLEQLLADGRTFPRRQDAEQLLKQL